MSETGGAGLRHVDGRGMARMVDVSGKPATERRAVATGMVRCSNEALRLLAAGELAKGDALAVARLAGIAATKKAPDLVLLCHPISISGVTMDVDVLSDGVALRAEVCTDGPTGVEMEALTAIAAAGLNVIDMIKAVDRAAALTEVRVEHKSGGASGTFDRAVDGVQGTKAEVSATTDAAFVVTISDRAADGTYPDESGPILTKAIADWGMVATCAIVPDDIEAIRGAVLGAVRGGAGLVLTTGGTGIGPRDVTPDALRGLLDVELPGIGEKLRAAGRAVAGAALSRGFGGLIGRTLIVALPGSPRAVREAVTELGPTIAHAREQLAGGGHSEGSLA